MNFDWLEQLPLGMVVVGARGETMWKSSAARELLGDEEPVRREWLDRALAGERVVVRDLEIRRPHRTITVEVSAAPIHAPDGKVAWVLCCYRDITEHRDAVELALRTK